MKLTPGKGGNPNTSGCMETVLDRIEPEAVRVSCLAEDAFWPESH
jgi:hypothetical protein